MIQHCCVHFYLLWCWHSVTQCAQETAVIIFSISCECELWWVEFYTYQLNDMFKCGSLKKLWHSYEVTAQIQICLCPVCLWPVLSVSVLSVSDLPCLCLSCLSVCLSQSCLSVSDLSCLCLSCLSFSDLVCLTCLSVSVLSVSDLSCLCLSCLSVCLPIWPVCVRSGQRQTDR